VQATTFIGDGSKLTGISTGQIWNSSGTNIFLNDTTASVGIGTDTPVETLSVDGNFSVSGNFSFVGGLTVGGDLVSSGGLGTADTTSSGWIDDGTVVRLIDATNKVGIGTASPLQTLVVVGTVNITDSLNVSGTIEATTFIGSGSALTGISSATPPWNSSGANVFLNDTTANVGIGTSSPTMELHVVGDVNISNNLYVFGNLTFGNSSDYAEMFESDVELEHADVVCLDEYKKIDKCTARADPSVIGVVSTNPSIIGRTGFEKAYPVGLIGVVPTKVIGPVDRFSMLTTSNKVGYAERATRDDFGAIIGKAMEACYEEQCVIDVVVNLQ
jgi:hypothetical protein